MKKHRLTENFKTFCDESVSCFYMKTDKSGNVYAYIYEMNGLQGKELEEYTLKNKIIHPCYLSNKEEQSAFIRTIIFPSTEKKCHCCG
jgi:hypothetical protein